MVSTKFYLSIDWGTTNFRMRLVNYINLKIMDEVSLENGGAKHLFDSWKKEGGSRKLAFINFLKQQITRLKIKIPPGTPVIISGMASSSIGVLELPYAALPFDINGKNAIVRSLNFKELRGLPVFLVSGIKSENDVMRGEETQLLGCIKENEHKKGEQLFIFPGTHSKHIIVKDTQVINFRTYMTGEFFELLAKKSLLSSSVNSVTKISTAKIKQSFEMGVKASINGNLLNEAFHVRTNQLFKKINTSENNYYLSGLLIGTELRELASNTYEQVTIVSGSQLLNFYQLAFKILSISGNQQKVSSVVSDKLVARGQYQILKNNLKLKW